MSHSENRTLFTIFNRNNPAPTANALRNITFEKAVVWVIGGQQFSQSHKLNLERFEVWISGLERPLDWPESLWRDDWNWRPFKEKNVQIAHVDLNLNNLLDSIQSGDIVDLTSGTKEQCGTIIKELGKRQVSADFVLQTRGGTTLHLDSGKELKNVNQLNMREKIWLSSGYILDFDIFGNPEVGELWADVRKTMYDKKIHVKEKEISEISSKSPETINLSGGYWLESATTHLLSRWPNISEVYLSPRLIRPNFTRAIGSAFFALQSEHKRILEKNPTSGILFEHFSSIAEIKDFDDRMVAIIELFSETTFPNEVNDIVRGFLHSVEIDALAFDASIGEVLVCECKTGNISPTMHTRILAISKTIFPAYGKPLLIHTKKDSKHEFGVDAISWPELTTPDILGRLPTKYQNKDIQEGSIRRKRNANQKSKRPRKQKPKCSDAELRRYLEQIRNDPQPYPVFLQRMDKDGYKKQGSLKRLKALASQLEFTIDDQKVVSGAADWIAWLEEE